MEKQLIIKFYCTQQSFMYISIYVPINIRPHYPSLVPRLSPISCPIGGSGSLAYVSINVMPYYPLHCAVNGDYRILVMRPSNEIIYFKIESCKGNATSM